jgi:hypothetical protein
MSNSSKDSPKYVKVRTLTARDVTYQPLMSYKADPKRRVKSSSLHELWFAENLEEWDTFEDEVEKNFANIPWADHSNVLAYDLPEDVSDFHLYAKDHFLCGEEISISGRYVQHALHPMSAVSKELEYEMVFGDWKTTAERDTDFVRTIRIDTASKDIVSLTEEEAAVEEIDDSTFEETPIKRRPRKQLIPDYALMVEIDGSPRAVGEVKTPWNHNFKNMWVAMTDNQNKMRMRRALGIFFVISNVFITDTQVGQIGNYMIELELKYGFLTNYTYTFFLKRVSAEGKETLYCSPPIQSDAFPLAEMKEKQTISVRQALLFLQTSVHGGKSAWYAKKVSTRSIIKKLKGETIGQVKERLAVALADVATSSAEHDAGRSPDANPEVDEAIGKLEKLEIGGNQQGPTTRSRARFADPPVSDTKGKKPARK